jgi:hypothetical protein
MALYACTCTFCEHQFYRITTPCEVGPEGELPEYTCPVCTNIFIDRVNLTPDAATSCTGCSSNPTTPGAKKSGGCGSCGSSGGCAVKTLMKKKEEALLGASA